MTLRTPELRFSLSNHPSIQMATFAVLFGGMPQVRQEVGPGSRIPTSTSLQIKKETIFFKEKKIMFVLTVVPRDRRTPSFSPHLRCRWESTLACQALVWDLGQHLTLKVCSFFSLWETWSSVPSV